MYKPYHYKIECRYKGRGCAQEDDCTRREWNCALANYFHFLDCYGLYKKSYPRDPREEARRAVAEPKDGSYDTTD